MSTPVVGADGIRSDPALYTVLVEPVLGITFKCSEVLWRAQTSSKGTYTDEGNSASWQMGHKSASGLSGASVGSATVDGAGRRRASTAPMALYEMVNGFS